VIDLSRAEGDSLEDISKIAIDITKAFNLSGKEFNRTADILVNASNASNVSIREVGESFKHSAGVLVEFDQSIDKSAALLAVLGNEAQRGSLSGTALRQIFVSLQRDASKSNSVLAKFGISLYESGQKTKQLNDKVRPLVDILLELGKKAGTAGNFINIFQARALTAALGIADESADAFAELVTRMGETGTAAKLASVRSESLVVQFGRLKASVQEFVLALGLQGGLLRELKNAVDGVRQFFVGLSQLDPRFLQLTTRLIVTAAEVTVMVAGFVSLAGAAAAVLSPLGQAAAALFALTESGKQSSIFEDYAVELKKLSGVFLEFASFVGNRFGSVLAGAIGDAFRLLARSLALAANNLGVIAEPIFRGLSSAMGTLASSAYQASTSMRALSDDSEETLTKMISGIQISGSLSTSLDQLTGSEEKAAKASQGFSQQIGEAQAQLNTMQEKLKSLTQEAAPASTKIREILSSLAGSKDAQGTILLLEEILHKTMDLEANLALAGGKNPGELLARGMEIAETQTQRVQEALGGFGAETASMVTELERLKAASVALGQENGDVFDQLIEKVRASRYEQKHLFTVEFGRGIQDGVQQMISGLLEGNRKALNAGELLRGALLGEFESLFRQIILRKLVFDKVFKDNFAGLGKYVQDLFGSIFSGASSGLGAAGGAIASLGKGILSAFGVPSFADGAVVSGPMLAMVGDAGSSGRGREVISPLDKLQGMMGGGGGTVVNLYTDQSSDRVNVREVGSDGFNRLVEVTVGAVEKNVLQRGTIHRALTSTTTARNRTAR